MTFSRDDMRLLEGTVATDVVRQLTGVVVQVDEDVCTLEYADHSHWACSAMDLEVAA